MPPPATWGPLEAVPVFVMAVLFGAVVTVAVMATSAGCGASTVLGFAAEEVGFVGCVVLWVKYLHHGSLEALGLPRRPSGDVAAGLAGAAVITLVSYPLGWAVSALATAILGHAPAQPEQIPACVHSGWLVSISILAVVLAPIGEETLFRGFLFKGLRRRRSFWPAALISGAVFGLAHYQSESFLLIVPSLIVVGVGLAFVYERRQSLLASVVAHGTFNLIGVLLLAASHR